MRTGTKRSLVLRGVRAILLAAAVLAAATGCSAPAVEDEAGVKPVVTDEQYALLDEMNQHADRAYQSMKDGDVEAARQRLVQLSVVATKLSYDGLTTIEGMEAVTEAISAAIHSLNAVQPNEQESLLEVIRVRLAVDALAHRGQPMWLEFRKPLTEDLSELQKAVAKHDAMAAGSSVKKWSTHVKLILAAILISKDPSEANKLESMTTFLEVNVSKKQWKALTESMPNLTMAIEDLFRSEDQETIVPLAPTEEPPHTILWSFTLGSVIIAVLAYVAWRRYQAEPAYVKIKSERDIDKGF